MRDMDSLPPASTTSTPPHSSSCAPDQIACRPLPHRRLTVNAGVLVSSPAASATARAL